MVKMCLHAKNEVPSYSDSKIFAEQTDRQTDPTDIMTYLHTRMVKMNIESMDQLPLLHRYGIFSTC